MHVQKVFERKLTAPVLILMNALRTLMPVDTMQFVLTPRVDINVNVQRDTMEMLLMDVHLHSVDVHLIENVVRTKSVFNLESVFAHRHSLLMLVISVEILANDSLAASMQNVVQPIHLSACVKLVTKEIRYKVV